MYDWFCRRTVLSLASTTASNEFSQHLNMTGTPVDSGEGHTVKACFGGLESCAQLQHLVVHVFFRGIVYEAATQSREHLFNLLKESLHTLCRSPTGGRCGCALGQCTNDGRDVARSVLPA